jgi:hypothetical protein
MVTLPAQAPAAGAASRRAGVRLLESLGHGGVARVGGRGQQACECRAEHAKVAGACQLS